MSKLRSHARIRKYLADYIRDRNTVWTNFHRQQVDRIYQMDPILGRFRCAWDERFGIAYAKRGERWLFPPGVPEHVQHAVMDAHKKRPGRRLADGPTRTT